MGIDGLEALGKDQPCKAAAPAIASDANRNRLPVNHHPSMFLSRRNDPSRPHASH